VLFESIDWHYPDKQVSLQFYLVQNFRGEPQGREGQEVRWVDLADLANYEFPEANRPVVEKLLAEFSA